MHSCVKNLEGLVIRLLARLSLVGVAILIVLSVEYFRASDAGTGPRVFRALLRGGGVGLFLILVLEFAKLKRNKETKK